MIVAISNAERHSSILKKKYQVGCVGPNYAKRFEYYSEGYTIREIAAKLHLQPSAVGNSLATRKHLPKWYEAVVPDILTGDLTMFDAHYLTGVPEWLINAFMFKYGDWNGVMTYEEIDESEKLGLSTAQMAAKYECGTRTVRRRRRYWRVTQ